MTVKDLQKQYKKEWYRKNKDKQKEYNERYWEKKLKQLQGA